MSDQLPLDLTPQPKRWRSAAVTSIHIRSHARAEEVLEGDRKAKRQEARVLELFRGRPDQRLTPSEVRTLYCAAYPEVPLTSIRRAMSNTTRDGLLVHWQAERRPGPYGRLESTWGLRGGTSDYEMVEGPI